MDTSKKIIILDRDGVINYDSDDYIKSAEEWVPILGSLEAISDLNKADYKVAIATNQSGIGRGYYNLTDLEEMHAKMQHLLSKVGGKIDFIAYCPHEPDDNCNCRKPKPGMLIEIAEHYSVSPDQITFIGDTISDMKAAQSANMNFILVRTGKGERTLQNKQWDDVNGVVYDSLKEFVKVHLPPFS